MRQFFFILHIFVLTGIAGANDLRVVVNNGHDDVINDISYHKDYNLLFSCGDDGTVRAWNPTSKKLVYSLRISHFPVKKITLDPLRPYIAVVEMLKVNHYRLSTWDWKKGKKLYSIDLETFPLFMTFSPKGSYLVYSLTQWKSLVFLNSKTGKQLPYLDQGFGIVSGFIISPSENTIMTYSPSGDIQYWRITEGVRRERIQTLKDLKHLSFTNNLRYMIGSRGDTAYMIDLISGEPKEIVTMYEEITDIALDPLSNQTVCITKNAEQETSTLNLLDFESFMNIRRRHTMSMYDSVTDIQFYLNTIFLSDTTGAIEAIDIDKEKITRFGYNTLLSISDLAFSGSYMVLPTVDTIFLLRSAFFSFPQQRTIPRYTYLFEYENPLKRKTAVERISDREFLLWTIDGESPGIVLRFNPRTGRTEGEELRLEAPLIDVHSIDSSNILTLEKNGRTSIISLDDWGKEFVYTAFGLQAVTYTGNHIIAGKSRSSGFNTPIIQINPKTGETVPIDNNNVLIFDLLFDSDNERLYSLGLRQSGTSFVTVVEEYLGDNFDLNFTLYSYDGEDLNASLILDEQTRQVFTSVGYEGIRRFPSYSNYRTSLLTHNRHIPRKGTLYEGILYSLNSNSSISVWDKDEGELLFDLYFFNDGNWLAQLPSGHYYGSKNADSYVGFYRESIPYTGNVERYRLQDRSLQFMYDRY